MEQSEVAIVELHFDGDIAPDHQVSLRTLSKSLGHLQSALDRAYLDIRHGNLWKYAKMHHDYYKDVEMLVQPPREGGYIIDFFSKKEITKKVVERVSNAINNAVVEAQQAGLENADTISKSLETKRAQIAAQKVLPRDYQKLLENPDPAVNRRYGDRAIVRDIDQMLAIIRSNHSGDSSLEISLTADRTEVFEFNRAKANDFHRVITRKKLGDPVIYRVKVTEMDLQYLSAKMKNNFNNSVSTLRFASKEDFQEVFPYFQGEKEMVF
ncbi:hypothetical protein CXI59_004304, partial [Salmonella enterica subsp. enterica serovar Hadar]|nr:hypothetical protein [Salmonella enterica subsp. enterica serovar Hadar]